MAYPSDRPPAYTETYDERYAYAPPTAVTRDRHEPPGRPLDEPVYAGPYRFGLRDAILGILAIFSILGLVLGVLGFAAAFSLDNAANIANDGGANNAEAAAAALPALLVSLLPFLAAPVLALGCGAWAGHASRDSRIGLAGGAIGAFLGPILMLLIAGIGFALGAGAASLNLADVNVPGGVGIAPGWGTTLPYLFTGAGLLWLVANTLAGALTGGAVGAIVAGWWQAREERRRSYTRRATRY